MHQARHPEPLSRAATRCPQCLIGFARSEQSSAGYYLGLPTGFWVPYDRSISRRAQMLWISSSHFQYRWAAKPYSSTFSIFVLFILPFEQRKKMVSERKEEEKKLYGNFPPQMKERHQLIGELATTEQYKKPSIWKWSPLTQGSEHIMYTWAPLRLHLSLSPMYATPPAGWAGHEVFSG